MSENSPLTDARNEPPLPPRRGATVVLSVLLSLCLLGGGIALAILVANLGQAERLIDQQRQEISDQQREIEEQRELLDEKETFSRAATDLMTAAAAFDGLPFATIVNTTRLTGLIERGWTYRENIPLLRTIITEVEKETDHLRTLAEAAGDERSANASGTYYEQITDELGNGFVATSLTAAQCGSETWGCVFSDEPFTIHYDEAGTASAPYMSDWLRAGVAYHEYAHVLQLTNPDATAAVIDAFDGDDETMADCYALTFLDGWTLDHRIWVSSTEYWDVSVGYGYTCTGEQQSVIRQWVDSLGYRHAPISQ